MLLNESSSVSFEWFGIESQMITCWEMFYYILTAFLPEWSWIFHLYSVGKQRRSRRFFSFPKGWCRRLKVHFHSQDSVHIFDLAIIKWKFKKKNKKESKKKKTNFFLTWLRWKSWHPETEKTPYWFMETFFKCTLMLWPLPPLLLL